MTTKQNETPRLIAERIDEYQPCPDPRCNDHLGASPMPQCVTAVYWSEEVLLIADVLRELSDQFNGIDNGRCTVCRVGHRLWIVPGKKKGSCDYEACLSHRIEPILQRYEPPSPDTLERIRKNCEAAIRMREQLKQVTRDAKDDADSAAIEAYWQDKQGEDYGSY